MNRRNFIHLFGCSCLSFGLSACGSAPITDRKQLKLIPESNLNAKAAQLYEKVKEKETDLGSIKNQIIRRLLSQ